MAGTPPSIVSGILRKVSDKVRNLPVLLTLGRYNAIFFHVFSAGLFSVIIAVLLLTIPYEGSLVLVLGTIFFASGGWYWLWKAAGLVHTKGGFPLRLRGRMIEFSVALALSALAGLGIARALELPEAFTLVLVIILMVGLFIATRIVDMRSLRNGELQR